MEYSKWPGYIDRPWWSMVACRLNLWRPSTTVICIVMEHLFTINHTLAWLIYNIWWICMVRPCHKSHVIIINHYFECYIKSIAQVSIWTRRIYRYRESKLHGACDISLHYNQWLARWRHQMETFSALLTLCVGNSPVTGEFPSQRPVTQSFGILLWSAPE